MRSRLTFLVLASLGALTVYGCPPGGPGGGTPDLIVSSITAGAATVGAGGGAEVPLDVVVENQGTGPAGVFKVSAQYSGGVIDPASTFTVAFTVPGQSDIWYPFTGAPLAAGDSVTFSGKLTFNQSETGVTVSVTATADSCDGDEFMPAHCRVQESDEGNNVSSPIAVALP